MKRTITAVLAATALAAVGLALAQPAQAAATPACAIPDGWYVNSPDEDNRKPDPGTGGLTFNGNQLIHHASAAITLADLTPGTFAADPAPDQNSFFSVEVRDATTGGYGTMRWNTDTSKWDLTTNTDQFHFTDTADAIGTQTKFGKLTDATRVISFGVGYAATPPGTVATVVASVTFAGKTYDLKCHPVATTSPAPTKTTVKPSHTTLHSASHSPAAGAAAGGGTTGTGALAITGPRTNLAIGIGGLLLAAGVGAFIAAYRRKTRFTA